MTIRDLFASLGDAIGAGWNAVLDASLWDVLLSVLGVAALLGVFWISIFGHELRVAREARRRAKRERP